jgi:hypothetical protein
MTRRFSSVIRYFLHLPWRRAAGFDSDHAGSVAVRMAIGQPEEIRRFRLLGHAASIGRKLCTFQSSRKTPALDVRGNKDRDRVGRDHSSTPRTNPTLAAAAAFLIGSK